ncbi:MAG: hypothetical protein F6K22_09735 [Okeania sp. SIO2F4]|uniref:hypothetical protein n=1 Tax=Okeania sp. SIO2F4 TaxID=2607790 RepID=UPI00142A46F9|nr:hypothetical protein [Okeania sp. SIO2F4]NES03108.1 hypothetical protein [Okeania sp. SIO2F4]
MNLATWMAVSAPVAHGGDAKDRAGKSLGATVRPEKGSALEGGAQKHKPKSWCLGITRCRSSITSGGCQKVASISSNFGLFQ